MIKSNENMVTREQFDEVVDLLEELFEQADQDTPGDYRTEHFRSAMDDVEEALIQLKRRHRIGEDEEAQEQD